MEERLINFVRENKFLYDKRHHSYKNNWLREKKFRECAAELNLPPKTLKQRWRTLRDKYMRDKKARMKTFGSVALSQKKWKYEDSLSFLDDVGSANLNTSGNYEDESTSISFEGIHESTSAICDDELMDSNKNTASINEKRSPARTRLKENLASRLEAAEVDFIDLTDPLRTELEEPKQPKTTTHMYFDMMAQQVEELNLSTIQFSMLQVYFQVALQDFVTKNLNNNENN
uniref:Transcription factor Adf-1 n=1 Tax=Ceratitis capitata TaxID=7213 RepID=W8BZK1_CERCA